eukprot:m.41989 g.41989  ORF g.41989 m.41989 type:complete len:85 (+) comp8268_c0_seq2:105-359(+)
MYLLHAKQKVDKEVRRKERAERKRERQKHRERKKLDSYDSLVSSWSDATFNCGYLGSFAVIPPVYPLLVLEYELCPHMKIHFGR